MDVLTDGKTDEPLGGRNGRTDRRTDGWTGGRDGMERWTTKDANLWKIFEPLGAVELTDERDTWVHELKN